MNRGNIIDRLHDLSFLPEFRLLNQQGLTALSGKSFDSNCSSPIVLGENIIDFIAQIPTTSVLLIMMTVIDSER